MCLGIGRIVGALWVGLVGGRNSVIIEIGHVRYVMGMGVVPWAPMPPDFIFTELETDLGDFFG
jgi:hypothetical protein